MVWQTLLNWFIAGCVSASALNFSIGQKEPVGRPETVQPALEEFRESPLQPVEPEPPFLTPASVVPAGTGPAAGPEPPQQSSEAAKEVPVVEEYRIQPEDVLQITVYEEPDLTTKVRVAGSGEINFPLLGRVSVGGLSVIQVQEKITKLLEADYLVNPQVQVFIETYHARDVFVTGAVNKPGSYPLPAEKPTTLIEAVAMAGGFDEEAALNGTKIIRIENGRETTINVKANDIIKKGDKAKDVEVRPNDVVFVPESFF